MLYTIARSFTKELKSVLAQMPSKKQSTLAEAWGKKARVEKGVTKPKRETVAVPSVLAAEKENRLDSDFPLSVIS